MSQPPRDHTLYSRIRSELGVPKNGFRSIAAMHVRYPNTSTHRTFRYPTQMLLSYYECQLSLLLDELDKIDTEIDRAKNEPQWQQFLFDKNEFIRRCLQNPNQLSICEPPKEGNLLAKRENLVANLNHIFKEYQDLFRWELDTHKFSRVSWKTQYYLAEHMKDFFGDDKSAVDYLRAIGDFVYTDIDPPIERLQHLILATTGWLGDCVRYLCCGTLLSSKGHTRQRVKYSRVHFHWLLKALIGLVSSALVLAPVGILFLGNLSKPISFVVVVIFGLAFTIIMLAFEQPTSHLLVGLAAFYAVLVAFLSNAG
ncbi:hypothetical protein F5Y19DRAFT_491998 [Xylariaceae sp. FL1651]|nr:hypothetical protein F5Y19DRAFT_491998 [Xylariaceae sp. FL1651]